MRKKNYFQILETNAEHLGVGLIGNNFTFMQVTDFKHTARVCKTFLADKEEEGARPHPPTESLDLNPIEKL
jgi:hypothetical protein